MLQLVDVRPYRICVNEQNDKNPLTCSFASDDVFDVKERKVPNSYEVGHQAGVRISSVAGKTLCTQADLTEVQGSAFTRIYVIGDLYLHHMRGTVREVVVIGNATIFKCFDIKNLKVYGKLTIFSDKPNTPRIQNYTYQQLEVILLYESLHCSIKNSPCKKIITHNHSSLSVEGDCSQVEVIEVQNTNIPSEEVIVTIKANALFHGIVTGGTVIRENPNY